MRLMARCNDTEATIHDIDGDDRRFESLNEIWGEDFGWYPASGCWMWRVDASKRGCLRRSFGTSNRHGRGPQARARSPHRPAPHGGDRTYGCDPGRRGGVYRASSRVRGQGVAECEDIGKLSPVTEVRLLPEESERWDTGRGCARMWAGVAENSGDQKRRSANG